MTGAKLLSEREIEQELASLPGWERVGEAIRKTFRLKSFAHALAFVSHVGHLAEVADHHPDIELRYFDVTLTLSTHSAGGITEKDLALAREIERAGYPARED